MKLYVSKIKEKTKNPDPFTHKEIKKFDMVFVYLTRDEALTLIESLAEQIKTGNPNAGRPEMFDNMGRYFTVAVEPIEK